MSNNKTYPGQEHKFSDIDETGLGAVDAVADDRPPASMLGEAWRQLRVRPIFWISAFLILLAVVVALFPSLFTSVNPFDAHERYVPANKYADPSWEHPFGCDKKGRDIYARVIYGARPSVEVGVLTMLLSVFIGTVMGSIAGYRGGWVDSLLSRITDIFFAIPFVLAAIVFMQMFKESRTVWIVVIVIAVFAWPQIARICRGAVMEAKQEEYVTAARALGSGGWANMIRHILPNAAAPIIVYATVSLGSYIVTEATLSFLGIGLPPTVISWGGDISDYSQQALYDHPQILFYPAGALALTVLGFILMGDVVRDALDPKARK